MFRKTIFAFAAAVAACATLAGIAGATEFVASKGGSVQSKQLGSQVITTKAGTITCGRATGTGEVEGTLSEETGLHESKLQGLALKYEECTAFGFASTVSNAEIMLNSNGTVSLENQVTVKGISTCVVTIPPQENLGSVSYTNKGEAVEVTMNLSGLESSGAGLCSYAKEKAGTYKGSSSLELVGGSITMQVGVGKLFKVQLRKVGGPEFKVAGEKGTLIWGAEPGVAEKVTGKAIIDPKPPYVATAFNLTRDTCENKEIKAGQPCEVEIEFTKPAEGVVKAGKENIVGIHPEKWAAGRYEAVVERGEW